MSSCPHVLSTEEVPGMTAASDVRTAADEVEQNISDVLKQLMTRRDETNADLAALLHCDVQTVGRKRRNERPWRAWEVRALATHYGWDVGVFYEGVDALFRVSQKDITAGYLDLSFAAA